MSSACRRGKVSFAILLCVMVCRVAQAVPASFALLMPDTLAAWEAYLNPFEAILRNPVEATAPFLLVDEDPRRKSEAARGKVAIWPGKRGATVAVPHGLIHDWLGAVFVPRATLKDVWAVARNYEKFPDWYGPTIVQGRRLASLPEGDGEVSSIRYVRRVMFVTATLDVDFENRYVQMSPLRWYSVSRSIRMREKDESKNADGPSRPEQGDGYVWRIYTFTRYEETDGGVYLEQESLALSRPIPASLHWLIDPVVRRLAKDLLEKSLTQTREAVEGELGK